jgi:hypothetical protein
VFENKVLRKMSGSRRDEVTEEWRILHNDELHCFFNSSSIVNVVKSRGYKGMEV